MNKRKFKRLVKESLEKPDLISLTNDDELMDRVLKRSAEMQAEISRQEDAEDAPYRKKITKWWAMLNTL